MSAADKNVTKDRLLTENEELRRRLEEAEQTIEAIRQGEVDAIVVAGQRGEQVYSLTGAEHTYRVIVETMNEAALTTDLDGTILFCNQRFCDLMRTPMHEVLGGEITTFAASAQRPVLRAVMAEAQAGSVRRHVTLRAADGTEVPVLLSASLLQTPESVSLCLVASDLTELEESAHSIRVLREKQQALEESEERYRRVFMDDLTGDFIATPAGKVIECNPAFAEIYGFADPAEAIAEGDLSRFAPDDWADVVARVVRGAKVVRHEARHRRPDGAEIYVVANVVGQFDEAGELAGLQGYVFDDTERKRAELALQETLARLEEQHEDLAAANEQLLTQREELHSQTAELFEANEKLRESEERYHRLFEDDLTGNLISTPEGQILLCNPAFAEIFGFRQAQDAIGTSMSDLYLEPAERGPLMERLKRQRKIERLEVWRRRRDGEPIYVVENLVGRFNDRGELYEIKGYVFDDTERKRAAEALRESEERFRTLADNMSQFAWMTDETGSIFWYNQRWYEYTGTTFEDMKGWGWQKVHHPDHVERVTEKFRCHVEQGLVWEDTFPLRGQDGAYRWFLSRAVPIHDDAGRVVRWFGTNTDITDRLQAEESLRELTQTLEARVAQRTRELEYRAAQLQKLALELSQAEERERRRLAEILHDDLQQQLAAAKFHIGILGGRAQGNASLQKAASQIDQMLADAIETSRSLSHELSPAVMYHGDLGEILEWLANQIRTKHGLAVRVDARGEINTQSDGLKTFLYKAVQELLFNAVKHARVQEATVRLRRRGPYLCVSVSDHGRGFDPQGLREAAGFGLLSIRERVALLGGRMKIESAPGRGSRFIVTVPDSQKVRGLEGEKVSVEQEGTLRPSEPLKLSPSSSAPRLRVLVADDHQIVRGGLVSLLADARDLDVVGEAGNGREAVDLAYRLKPDVVIMDVAMPLISGEEATRQILRHLPETRVVALSMYEEPGMVEKMRQAGAQSYVLKTAPYDELLAAVRGTR